MVRVGIFTVTVCLVLTSMAVLEVVCFFPFIGEPFSIRKNLF